MDRRPHRICALACILVLGTPGHTVPPAPAAHPVLAYTDIVSGPNHGGENDEGIYLTLFGKGFGHAMSGIKVFIGGREVSSYRSLGPARGRPDIEQVTVQIGALGEPTPGVPLPVKIVVNGQDSTQSHSFTVNPGKILFVDNRNGNDASARPNDITHPYRHAQNAKLGEAAWGAVGPGDFIVLRGTGKPWTDHGFEQYFVRVADKSGSMPTGRKGSGPISIMGYPGEDVFIDQPYDAELEKTGASGGIAAANGQKFAGKGQWVSVSNLRIESGGHDGPINVEVFGHHWRIVNNDVSARTAIDNINAKAAGIAGNGRGQVWLGNRIHDIYCGPVQGGPKQNHGVYLDGDGDYEIAFNLIEDIWGGNGIQAYANGGNGSAAVNDIHFHHNMIRRVAKHGINLADGTARGVQVYNNIVTDTAYAGLRLNTTTMHRAKIYNNTFFNTNMSRTERYGALVNDWQLPADAVDLRNNIFSVAPGTDYVGGSVGFGGSFGTSSRNFWHGGPARPGSEASPPQFDEMPQSGPLLFMKDGIDFRLRPQSWAVDAGSPLVGSLVTDDFGLIVQRPQGLGYDIGAFEMPR